MKGFFGALEGLLVRAPDGKGDYETAMENYYIAASIGANADLKNFFTGVNRCGPSNPKIPKKLFHCIVVNSIGKVMEYRSPMNNPPSVRRVEVAPATRSFGRSSCQRFDNDDEPVSNHNDDHHDGGSCERRQKGNPFLYLGDVGNKAMFGIYELYLSLSMFLGCEENFCKFLKDLL